jgi:hypothetical protein
LVELLDLLDPSLDPPVAVRGRRALAALAPWLPGGTRAGAASSPLSTVGACLLARRLVAELAAWAASSERWSPAFAVELVVPPPDPRSSPVRIAGELSGLNDPSPCVLAIALERPRLRAVESLLRRVR